MEVESLDTTCSSHDDSESEDSAQEECISPHVKSEATSDSIDATTSCASTARFVPKYYTLVPRVTQRGSDILLDSQGYQYLRKADKRQLKTVTWRCRVPAGNHAYSCKATVRERDGVYKCGSQPHTCDSPPGTDNKHPQKKAQTAIKEDPDKKLYDIQPVKCSADTTNSNKSTRLKDLEPVKCTVVTAASNRGGDILVDCDGYEYSRKIDRRRRGVLWRCRSRQIVNTCKTLVYEEDGVFHRTKQPHTCTRNKGHKQVTVLGSVFTKLEHEDSISSEAGSSQLQDSEITDSCETTDVETEKASKKQKTDISTGDPESNESAQCSSTTSQNQSSVQCTLIVAASNRGKAVLLDDQGYEYCQKVDKRRSGVIWRCRKWDKSLMCHAVIYLRDGVYIRGKHPHTCKRERGKKQVSINASGQADEEQEDGEPAGFSGGLTYEHLLKWNLERYQEEKLRQKNTVKHPRTSPLVQPRPTMCTLHPGATKQGKDVLEDSDGHKYCRKVDKRRKENIWRCRIRRKNAHCNAIIREKDGIYYCGPHPHTCNNTVTKSKNKKHDKASASKQEAEAPEAECEPGQAFEVTDQNDLDLTEVQAVEMEEHSYSVDPSLHVVSTSSIVQTPGSTQCTLVTAGQDILVDSLGYQYIRAIDEQSDQPIWRCMRQCSATITELNGEYIRDEQPHYCMVPIEQGMTEGQPNPNPMFRQVMVGDVQQVIGDDFQNETLLSVVEYEQFA